MSSEFDRRLNDWFDTVDPREVPADILPGALRGARGTRQQRAPWHRFVATIESAWTTRTSLSPSLVLAILAVLLTVALAGAAVASGLVPRPSPATVDGLIAVQDRFEAVPDGQLPAYVIRFLDPQTGADAFTTPADYQACGAHVSPDGSHYAFLSGIPRADGGRDIWVAVAPVAPDFQPTLLLNKPAQSYFDPSWAPDGSALVMTVEAEPLDAGLRELWVVPVDGTPARRLTDAHTSLDAQWSSSGNWIAFLGHGAEGQAPPLYIVRPDGSDLRLLRPSGGKIAWSPHRDELAYAASDGKLHVVGVDGTEIFTAANDHDQATSDGRPWPTFDGVPVWSPDATTIAVATPDGALEVFDVATSSVSKIATPAPISLFEWSANGRSVIAVADDGDLWEISIDGAAPRLIAAGVQDWCMSAGLALSWQRLSQ